MKPIRYYDKILDENRRGVALTLIRYALSFLSFFYHLAIWWRLKFYQWGLLKGRKLEAKVISVGNITLGGAGKTPVVGYLAELLRDHGQRVAVLSRGYKRRGQGIKVVSDGRDVLTDWRQAGDEPFLLATNLPQVPITVGKDRFAAAGVTTQHSDSQVFILDDGFQHLKLERNLDIVVIDGGNPFGNGKLFPRGDLREPLQNLCRADVLWLTRIDQANSLVWLKERLKEIHPRVPVVESVYRPHCLCKIGTDGAFDPKTIKGKRVVALSSIANPLSFEITLCNLGALIVEAVHFPDHHWYSAEELIDVCDLAKESEAEMVVTTEKDSVRFPKKLGTALPIYYLKIKVKVLKGWKVLEEQTGIKKWGNHPVRGRTQ